MSTERVILPALAWCPLDGSAGNLPAKLDWVQSSGGPPGPRYPRWHFPSAQLCAICCVFRVPANYNGDPVLKYDYMTTAYGYSPHTMKFGVAAISATEAILTKAFDTLITDTVDGDSSNANVLVQESIDLSSQDDDMVANDLACILVQRDGTHEGDVGDMKFFGGVFEYTVS